MSVFFKLLTYVRRTVLRARTRSILTVLGMALAMALFAFVRMLESGVDRLSDSADQPVLVVFQSSRFCPLTSELPMRYQSEIERMDGVESVLPTLLFINSCRANLDLVTLHGVPGTGLDQIHDFQTLAGDSVAWAQRSDGALVGQRLAQRRGLRPGDRVRLGNVDVHVSGIIQSDTAGLDNLAFVNLKQLQLARDKQGIATQFMVRLTPGTNPDQIAQQIDERFRTDEQPTDTKTMQAFVQGAVGEVAEVVDFARLLGYLAVAVVILILGNTVYISSQTRSAEFGVMETIGVSPTTLSGLVLAESLTLSVFGAVLGVGAVAIWLLSDPLTLGVEGWGINVEPDMPLVWAAAAVTLLVGVLASVGPAIETLRRNLALAVKPD